MKGTVHAARRDYSAKVDRSVYIIDAAEQTPQNIQLQEYSKALLGSNNVVEIAISFNYLLAAKTSSTIKPHEPR